MAALAAPRAPSLRKRTGRKEDNLTYEATIHLAKLTHGKKFNKRAPHCHQDREGVRPQVDEDEGQSCRCVSQQLFVEPRVKGVPGRVRVRIARKGCRGY